MRSANTGNSHPPLTALTTPVELPRDVQQQARTLISLIDHTILAQNSTPKQIAARCEEALSCLDLLKVAPASICVNGCDVVTAVNVLGGSAIRTCAAIGFPLGKMSSDAKYQEAYLALRDGAQEIDVVMNVGMLKGGDHKYVRNECNLLAKLCHEHGALLKVILETCALTQDEKRLASALCMEAGVDFVKTSTGFGEGGATVEDIKLMREVVGVLLGVKASGGIKSIDQAAAMVRAGATRIGASSLLEACVRLAQGGGAAAEPSRAGDDMY